MDLIPPEALWPGPGLDKPEVLQTESVQVPVGIRASWSDAEVSSATRTMDASLVSVPSRASQLHRFGTWMAEALNHAFGNPREEAAFMPPAIGVQPYSGIRRRRGGRLDD
ncbi:MAG: hypothetical protein VKI42_01865 [Synechococcaceae cyanobacterium]|nr:hypothetical protein [Synechococcaceae cyanobacterium]